MERDTVLFWIAVIFTLLAILFCIGGWLWTYTINTWLVFAESSKQIEFWQGGLIAFIPGIGQVMIPAALGTWVFMLFLD